MQVAVYPGSFNPMHKGHLAIIKLLCISSFDQVRLIVSPQNPLKQSGLESNAQQRLQAAEDAIARHALSQRVKVDDIEFTLPSPRYTIATLDELSARNPEDSFTLVMGADNLEDIRRWKDYRRILEDYGVAVYPRDGAPLDTIKEALIAECPLAKIQILDAPEIKVSSTQIREMSAKGEDITSLLA